CRRITLKELPETSSEKFEAFLVERINNLANPIDWVILFMYHIHHRFNTSMLRLILARGGLEDFFLGIDIQVIIATLRDLNFVRRLNIVDDEGDNIKLHD